MNELVNTLDQMLKNFHLDDQLEISLNDDQPEKIQLRRLGRERRASKFAEEMFQYDPGKKMPRADMITIRNKFSYKKILKYLIHVIWLLVTLITDQSSDKSQILRDVAQRSD